MPYITPNRRQRLDPAINVLANAIRSLSPDEDLTNLDGDLNYTITRLLTAVLELVGAPKYHKFNTATGVLECCKMELYRRLVAKYEDIKIESNGDVF